MAMLVSPVAKRSPRVAGRDRTTPGPSGDGSERVPSREGCRRVAAKLKEKAETASSAFKLAAARKVPRKPSVSIRTNADTTVPDAAPRTLAK